MAADASELTEFAQRLGTLAAANFAVPMVEALAEEWADVSTREVLVDTGQTRARTGVSHVGGTAASARGEVVSDTPYAGWIEFRWKPYFSTGRDAALRLADMAGGELKTQVVRVLNSGGSPNPRSLFR